MSQKYGILYLKNLVTIDENQDITLSDEECKIFLKSIEDNPVSKKHFYMAIDLLDYKLIFQHNLSEFLGLKHSCTLEDFFDKVHPDYIGPFLEWAKSAHYLINAHAEYIDVLGTSYKITLPVMSESGNYYWVLQESYALQLNKLKQILTQFNIYTVVSKYDQPQEIVGWITTKYGIDEEKDAELKKFYNNITNFRLTLNEKQLIGHIKKNNSPSYKEISIVLGKSEETIKKHAKNIIQKAKISFPHIFNQKEKSLLKTLIEYLEHINYVIES
jgi:hypothetical protein